MKGVNINYLHLCDAANIDSLGKVSVLGIFNKIFLAEIPSKFPKFTVVGNLSFNNLEKNSAKIELKFVGPNKESLNTGQPIVIEIKSSQSQNKGDINLILDIVNLEFKSFGKHVLNIYLNDENIGNCGFDVEKRVVN